MNAAQRDVIESVYGVGPVHPVGASEGSGAHETPPVGLELRRRREDLRLSVAEASRRAEISENTWTRVEAGGHPRRHTLAAMCRVLSEAEAEPSVSDGSRRDGRPAPPAPPEESESERLLRSMLHSYIDGLSAPDLRAFFLHSAEHIAKGATQ